MGEPAVSTNKYQESLLAQQEMLQQMRTEALLERKPISVCVESLKQYCTEHYDSDCLVKGFTKSTDNPFREKGGCTIV